MGRGNSIRLGEFVSDVVDLYNRTQATLALSTTADDTAALAEGTYDVWCDAECFLSVAPTDATGVTTANGYILQANTVITLYVRQDHKIGGIVASGTATLSYHKIG